MAATPSSEARTGLKLISPTAIYVILLLAVPLATVLIYSVLTGGRGNVSLPLTLENYSELASKSVYAYILFKSLMVALAVTFITVMLAYPVAYFVSFHIKPERKSLWLFLITIPFWTSYIIRVSLWFVILGYDGVLDKTLMSLGIIDTQLNFSSYGIPAIIFVLAHAYLREDHVLDDDLPIWVPIPALAEIQIALEKAVAEVTQLEGYELKRIMRTGTVATIDNRNWELRDQSGPVRRLSQSRAVALDMESATIAANGFRFRVPYGTLLCVSDKPLHGELKLPGMASEFYKTQVSRHLQIGIRAMERLRDTPIERLHSRKLRSFEETAFL